MARLMTMFIILIAIQATLMLYTSMTAENTSLWQLMVNTDKWNSADFFIILGGVAASVALAGISSGGTFRFVTDFLTLGIIIAGLIASGVVIMNLAGFLRSQLVSTLFTSCSSAPMSCSPVNWILAFTVGPLFLYYAWTVIDWWRGRDQ